MTAIKSYELTVTFRLDMNPIQDSDVDSLDFTDVESMSAVHREMFLGMNRALQAAFLRHPELRETLIPNLFSAYLDSDAGGMITRLLGSSYMASMADEARLVQDTEEPHRSRLQNCLDEGLLSENTELFGNACQVTPITAEIREL